MTDRELLEAIFEKLVACEAQITKIDEFVEEYKEMLHGFARDKDASE